MIASAIFVSISLIAAISFFWVVRYGSPDVYSEQELDARLLPVDLASIANLYDPEQIEFVRLRLSTHDFTAFERDRSKVLAQYVKRLFRNSGLLVGFAHRIDENEGSDLLAQALSLRIESMRILALLYVKILFPQLSIKLDQLVFSYRLVVTTAHTSDSLIN